MPEREWREFMAAGFSEPVSGMIFRSAHPPCCGVPIGGIGTGCLDIDTRGVIGFCNIFQNYPRQAMLFQPFLGLAIRDRTWVLASDSVIQGDTMKGCIEPGVDPRHPNIVWARNIRKSVNVQPAEEIHYWGHYPVVDMEYETNSPVSIGLRAWAPFIPGDANDSNIPGAVFQVHLRNRTASQQQGSLAFSFPGPTKEEAGSECFARRKIKSSWSGVQVSTEKLNYVIGVLGEESVRLGGSLDSSAYAWERFSKTLPKEELSLSGSTVAVDFTLAPREARTLRFVLTWFVPRWGVTKSKYTRMYARRYADSVEVADDLSRRHEHLLRRVLAWQQVIFMSHELPVWLRDMLVNTLATITEDSYWAQPVFPLEWAGECGLFGMMESPRFAPQIECIPCSWYGNLPIVYFFPELAHSTLKGYKQYQAENGAPPFVFGPMEEMWAPTHAYQDQICLNGVCFVDMVDRMWQRTGDDILLHEFYQAVKKSTFLTAVMGETPASVISFPRGEHQTEWWEGWPWTGMATHAGGLHLSNMMIAERMARHMGDKSFADQCAAWLTEGRNAIEENMWVGRSYLLYWNPNNGEKSDKIMANQLDAEWANALHGLPGVFLPDRVKTVLATVEQTCLVWSGAVSFASFDTGPELTSYGIFPPEILILAMTYIYNRQQDVGLEIARRLMENLVRLQGHGWDMPNQIRANGGQRQAGTDYYQNMILWALPAALARQDINQFCKPGGLVDRIIQSGRRKAMQRE